MALQPPYKQAHFGNVSFDRGERVRGRQCDQGKECSLRWMRPRNGHARARGLMFLPLDKTEFPAKRQLPRPLSNATPLRECSKPKWPATEMAIRSRRDGLFLFDPWGRTTLDLSRMQTDRPSLHLGPMLKQVFRCKRLMLVGDDKRRLQ